MWENKWVRLFRYADRSKTTQQDIKKLLGINGSFRL